MQSWRKGIKSTPSSSSLKADDKDTVIPLSVPTSETFFPAQNKETSSDDSDKLPDVGNKMAPKQFFNTCRKLSEFALELCSEDEKIAMARSLVMMGLLGDTPEEKDLVEMGEHMMNTFYEQFHNSFNLILSKNDEFFALEKHFILDMLHAKERWALLPTEKKALVWTDLVSLVQYANIGNMYKLCPDRMMNIITGMAEKVSKQVQSGEMDLSSLNPMDLGKSIVSSMSQAEIEEIGKSLMKKDTMENMMRMMETSMKSMEGMGMPNLGRGGGGMPDLKSLASMASMFAGKK